MTRLISHGILQTSPSNQAICKLCRLKIPQGVSRVECIVESHRFRVKDFYHLHCALVLLRKEIRVSKNKGRRWSESLQSEIDTQYESIRQINSGQLKVPILNGGTEVIIVDAPQV